MRFYELAALLKLKKKWMQMQTFMNKIRRTMKRNEIGMRRRVKEWTQLKEKEKMFECHIQYTKT